MPDLFRLPVYVFGALAVAGLVSGLVGILTGRRPTHLFAAVAAAVVALAGLEAGLAVGSGEPWAPRGPWLASAGLLLCLAALRSDRLTRAVARELTRSGAPRLQWALLVLGCVASASAALLGRTPEEPAAAAAPALQPGLPGPMTVPHRDDWMPPVVEMPSGTAVTDAGSNVAVWEPAASDKQREDLRGAEEQELRRVGLLGQVIRLAPADRSCNCFGWVFTGGRFLIQDAAVPAVLRENGYKKVAEPAPGDLVVYRGTDDAVSHVATVWGRGYDGRWLLASKWAWMGVYLHAPESTPYGLSWTYYRSRRRGHLFRGLEQYQPKALLPGADRPRAHSAPGSVLAGDSV